MLIGDTRADAPELAHRGKYGVGLSTLQITQKGLIDVLSANNDPEATIDRTLDVFVWYPAVIPDGVDELTQLTDFNILREEGFTYDHRALMDADPDRTDGPYPLLIISHGLGGSRHQLSYLGDNLASKGYVVVALDHAEEAVDLTSVLTATTYRPLDIWAAIDEMAALNADTDSFLHNLVRIEDVGLIGYSYGGYGVLVTSGASLSEEITAHPILSPGGAASIHGTGNLRRDPRIKAVYTFAPFGADLSALGMQTSYWGEEGLSRIEIPLFIMTGSQDDVAGYENGSIPIFEGTTGTQRHLLTILNARHNVAPNPPPPTQDIEQFMRHGEPAWSNYRLNNISQHFVTAFMGLYLKGEDYDIYLELLSESGDSWLGFTPRTAVGMEFRTLPE